MTFSIISKWKILRKKNYITHLETIKSYFDKQWRTRWNAKGCDISSESALFTKPKTQDKKQYPGAKNI